MRFRLQPRSVYYQWLDDGNEGRECVYVEGRNDGKLITRGGKGDFLLVGRRVTVDPNGFLARSKSRYSITEAGLDGMVRRLEDKIAHLERGDTSLGIVRYQGRGKIPELDGEFEYLTHDIPPGADPAFPNGALRHWYFDPQSARLVLLKGEGPKGELLEYYLFDRLIVDETIGDEDFNPDVLWPQSKPEQADRKATRESASWTPTKRIGTSTEPKGLRFNG